MIMDLVHNYIVKSTMTDAFRESLEKNLIPLISEKYSGLSEIQMYEDYIADAFYQKGEWYYPLTVVTVGGPITQWIKWKMKAGSFKDGVPYAYVGAGLLDFALADDVPEEFFAKLVGRSRYYEGGSIEVCVDTTVNDPTLLVGKYSQTFVDEMARQLTVKIEKAMSVKGIAKSSLSLSLVFAPATYMEHTSENVTYRRLLLTDKASAPRDFWVKWFREDGATAYTVSDAVSCENITFEIGEDASQKIREKEYRFLISAGADKYHNAMGRKNITEWRELVKRAVKRGELEKVEIAEESSNDDINKRLIELLGKAPEISVTAQAPVKEENEEFVRAMQYARSVVSEKEEESEATEIAFEAAPVIEEIVTEEITAEEITVEEAAVEEPLLEETVEEAVEEEEISEPVPAMIIEDVDYASGDDDFEDIVDEESLESEEEEAEEPADDIEAKIRAELEAKIRAEYEAHARKVEEELRRKNEEALRAAAAENERLRKLEEARRAEEERLRAQLEQQLMMEARERERMAEAARAALEEQKKAEAEAAAKAKAKEDAERLAAFERQRAEEAARIEAERKAEAERLRKEADERAKASKAAEAISSNARSKNYTYTSKSVRLLFRRSVDPNITSRIYEIIKTTLEYYGKDKMYMRIKATIPDTTTVILEFVEIPMEEMTLLSNIIKVLGNSGLGIAKAIVE